MLEEKLLKILIREVLEEKIKLRTSKGYSASHPIVNHKPFMQGLGKSDYEDKPEFKKSEDQKPVKAHFKLIKTGEQTYCDPGGRHALRVENNTIQIKTGDGNWKLTRQGDLILSIINNIPLHG
jgi:hypothetical protein